jgi:hypothetical protein
MHDARMTHERQRRALCAESFDAESFDAESFDVERPSVGFSREQTAPAPPPPPPAPPPPPPAPAPAARQTPNFSHSKRFPSSNLPNPPLRIVIRCRLTEKLVLTMRRKITIRRAYIFILPFRIVKNSQNASHSDACHFSHSQPSISPFGHRPADELPELPKLQSLPS